MKLNFMVFLALTGLGIAACSAPNGQGTSPATAASSTSAADTGINNNAFSGDFAGIIACSDCQGIQTKLRLSADGSYKLEETFAGRKTNNFLSSQGRWQNQDGQHFVLVPSEQGWEQRPFEVLSKNEIRQLGKDGKPYNNDASYHLKRVLEP